MADSGGEIWLRRVPPSRGSAKGSFTRQPVQNAARESCGILPAWQGRAEPRRGLRHGGAQGRVGQQAVKGVGKGVSILHRDQKAGAEVTVMEGLGALVSPERNGWFAEKLALPDTVARCLPA